MIKGNRYVSIRVNFLFFPWSLAMTMTCKIICCCCSAMSRRLSLHNWSRGCFPATVASSTTTTTRRGFVANSEPTSATPFAAWSDVRQSIWQHFKRRKFGRRQKNHFVFFPRKISPFYVWLSVHLQSWIFSHCSASRHYPRTYSYVLDVFNESLSR